ncbi:MAG TPA: hypothetical protein VMS18_03960 [Candidatus Binatia bacterium]|nr:hypothetical protein [Candidatus Binatia bacterium]
MSINPVQENLAAAGAQPATRAIRPQSAVTPEVRPPHAKSGAEPMRDAPPAIRPSESSEIPRDEVQVQRDNESSGQIVIKYLDHSGQVILQIPSSQVLGLARAIEKALEEQANRRGNASQNTAVSKGVTSNG